MISIEEQSVVDHAFRSLGYLVVLRVLKYRRLGVLAENILSEKRSG